VAISRAKGTPKDPVARARLVRESGVEGDAHAGQGPRQVSLLALPGIRAMEAKFGAPLGFGRFGENLVVDGELAGTEVGDLLAVGDRAVLEVTAIGKVCHKGCAIRQQTGDCIMPREGVFARVIVGGDVAQGDPVRSLRPSEALAVVVLAGGKSSRFAGDKRAAELAGITLLDRALATARAVSPRVLVSVAADDGGREFPGAVTVPDTARDAGPLAGIVAAMRACDSRRVLVLPVDSAGVTADLLRVLAARCDGPGLALVHAGVRHPLPACYDRASLPVFEAALAEGRRAVHAAGGLAGVTFVDAAIVADLGDPARLLFNVNTLEDLAELARMPGLEEGTCAT